MDRRYTIKILENSDTRDKYWDSYYRGNSAPNIPSQFAVFFANEISPDSVVVELGSGNGRDAMFLSSHVKHLIAVDGSKAAIDSCITSVEEGGIKNIDFIRSLIDNPQLVSKIQNKLSRDSVDGPLYIFSRFFLHSINDRDEDQLIILIDQLLRHRTGAIYIEFRTKEDECLSKYTGTHYRRYVEPSEFAKKFNDIGYVVDYFVQGTGFAKYKVDDAHVARLVLKKR